MKISKEKKGQHLNIKIHFPKSILNSQEYAIVTLCGIAGYFVEQHKLEITVLGLESLWSNDIKLCDIHVSEQDIHVIIYIDHLQMIMKKVNEMLIWMGCQTFLNVYFNLYNSHGYKDILEFYEMIKKEV